MKPRLIFFFQASKIREKKAKFNSSAPIQKLKNLVNRILGKEFLYPMHQIFFFLASKVREEM